MIDVKFKLQFFDSAAVIRAVDDGARRALAKVGAFVRRRAKSSMRKGKGIADPGKPPKVHAGQLKDLLFFSYDPATKSVVIGPTPFKQGDGGRLQEFGGQVTRRTRKGTRTLNYRPHPFMGPALAAEEAAGTIPAAWANTVRGR